jgi:hypothetical protein
MLSVTLIAACTTQVDTLSKVDTSSKSMPNLIGKPYDEAISILDDLPFDVIINSSDLIENRSIWIASNWVVLSQGPNTGALISGGSRVCLGVTKNDETSKSQNYVLPDTCPIGETSVVDSTVKSGDGGFSSTTLSTISEVESAEQQYFVEILDIVSRYTSATTNLAIYFAVPDVYDQMWTLNVVVELMTYRDLFTEAKTIVVPSRFASAHKILLSALSDANQVSFDLPVAVDNLSSSGIDKQAMKLQRAATRLDKFTLELKKLAG